MSKRVDNKRVYYIGRGRVAILEDNRGSRLVRIQYLEDNEHWARREGRKERLYRQRISTKPCDLDGAGFAPKELQAFPR